MALGDLFEQTVRAATDAGLVKPKHVAVDGTKVKANASKHRAMSYYERMLAEEKLCGKESGWRPPPRLATPEKRREFIANWPKDLEARAKTEEKTSPGPRPRSISPTPSRGS